MSSSANNEGRLPRRSLDEVRVHPVVVEEPLDNQRAHLIHSDSSESLESDIGSEFNGNNDDGNSGDIQSGLRRRRGGGVARADSIDDFSNVQYDDFEDDIKMENMDMQQISKQLLYNAPKKVVTSVLGQVANAPHRITNFLTDAKDILGEGGHLVGDIFKSEVAPKLKNMIENAPQNISKTVTQVGKRVGTALTDPRAFLKELDQKQYRAKGFADYDISFKTIDLYSALNFDAEAEAERERAAADKTKLQRLWYWVRKEQIATILFVPMLGVMTAFVSMLMDFLQMYIEVGRGQFAALTDDWFLGFLGWIFYCLMFCLIAVSCIQFISPFAVGSGIPEIKSILCGIDLSRVLSWKTALAKFIGLTAALGGGLSLGRTGPFMHMACCFAHEMMKWKIFENVGRNEISRFQMIIAACAAGVTANFGSPIGALLFSIEVTGTSSVSGNLWKGIICAAFCDLSFYIAKGLEGNRGFISIYTIEWVPHRFKSIEIVSFILLGIVTGLFGALIVSCFRRIVQFRLKHPVLRNSRIGLVATIGVLTAAISYICGPMMKQPLQNSMKQLVRKDELPFLEFGPDSARSTLVFFLGIKSILALFNVVLPVPGGIITPSLVLGAAAGRLFGVVMDANIDTGVTPAGFAIVGAAGLVSGVTRALAPAVMILEMTGQFSLLIPTLIATSVAGAVGNSINLPLFTTVLKIQGLPILSDFRSSKVYSMKANHRSIMRKKRDPNAPPSEPVSPSPSESIPAVPNALSSAASPAPTLTPSSSSSSIKSSRSKKSAKFQENLKALVYFSYLSTVKEMEDTLKAKDYGTFPIVEDPKTMMFIGSIDRPTLHVLLENHKALYKPVDVEVKKEEEPQPAPVPAPAVVAADVSDIQARFDKLEAKMRNPSASADEDGAVEAVVSVPSAVPVGPRGEADNFHGVALSEDIAVEAVHEDHMHIELEPHPWDAWTLAEILQNDAMDEGLGAGDASKGRNIRMNRMFNVAPFQIPALTPLNKVFHLFNVLGLGFAYITQLGRLEGVITKTDLIKANF